MKNSNSKGFTLIEIAIVLLIVSILLGYTVSMFPAQQNLKNYRTAVSKIQEIRENLIAYAQVNGRLPCPDTGVDGLEDTVNLFDNLTGLAVADAMPDGCGQYFGQIPYATLGMTGDIDDDGNFVDPWGERYRYHISAVESLGVGNVVDLVSANAIRNVGINVVTANPSDLFICDDSTVLGVDADCTAAGANSNLVAGNLAVVIASTGKNRQTIASNVQVENTDNDLVYVSKSFSDVAANEYDDIVKWISPNIIISKMIEAGQLP